MECQLTSVLRLKTQPVAVILTDEKPADGLHFKKGAVFGCVGSMLVAASKGRTALDCSDGFGWG